MAITTAFSLEEAREHLKLWKDCARALASGQAQSYRIGSRELTLINMDEIKASINYFSNIINSLTGTKRRNNVRRVVPRDL
jgi:hypothetical protein